MQRLSLRLRLTLLTGLLTGTTILAFALAFYLLLETSLLREIDADLRARADLVTRALAPERLPGAAAELPAPTALQEFAAPGIYVQLIAANGQTTVSPNLPGGTLPTDPAAIAEARAGWTVVETIAVGNDEQLRLLVVPAPAGGVLVVAESLEPLQRTLVRARALLLTGGALAVVLALTGAMLATSRGLAPIRRLTSVAAGVASTGNYQERVPLPATHDEVWQLAQTINALIATVERTLIQQRQFLADTSHELRSPLTTVLANLALLKRDLDPADRSLSLQEATDEAYRMRALVNDLLLLAQADVERAIAHAPVRLDLLVEEMVALAGRRAETHRLQACVKAPVVVIGDVERLRQMLRNLLDNATHHTPPGTRVDVRLRRSPGLAQISVADTGPGISPEHLPHVWNRFYRADKARSRAMGGSGLGLAIVKYIAEAHGGRVGVTSGAGAGTTFTVVLPLAIGREQVLDRPAASGA